jgi:curli biogenesis system outer membrane secretion channel CsgG
MKLKQTKSIIISAILYFLSTGCNGGATSGLLLKEHPRTVAVLDFEQDGFLGGEKLGGFAADELTAALFLKKKFEVVDRARVKAGVLDMNLANGIMPADAIKKLGQTLGADYLVLGKITRLNDNDFDPGRRDHLDVQITFRRISTRDGAVIGVLSRRGTSKGDTKKFVSDMLGEMAGAVKVKRET